MVRAIDDNHFAMVVLLVNAFLKCTDVYQPTLRADALGTQRNRKATVCNSTISCQLTTPRCQMVCGAA